MTAPAPIRLGVVGPGILWRTTHRPVLLGLPADFRIVAVSARTTVTLEAELARIPGARGFLDYRELVQQPDVDAVVVTTPIGLNAPVTLAALAAGKDVLVEKPLATTAAEAAAVLEAERRAGRRVGVLEQVLYTPAWDALRAALEGGVIGTVSMYDHFSHGFIGSTDDPWGYGQTAWRKDGQFPLGPLFDGGIHTVAGLARLFGVPRHVSAAGQRYREEQGEFDNITMLFRYEGGQVGVFGHSGFLNGNRNYFHIRGTAGLIVNDIYRYLVEPRGGAVREVAFAADAGAFFGSLHAAMWRRVSAVLRGHAVWPYTVAMAAWDVATLGAVEAAIRSGGTVDIHAFGRAAGLPEPGV